jgi:hypothetical protein
MYKEKKMKTDIEKLEKLILSQKETIEKLFLVFNEMKSSLTADVAAVTKPKKARVSRDPNKPRIADAIQLVMEAYPDITTPDEIKEKIEERNWLPRSKNPARYIRFILSRDKRFAKLEGAGRGHYRLALVVPPECEDEDDVENENENDDNDVNIENDPVVSSSNSKKVFEDETPDSVVDKLLVGGGFKSFV